MRPHIAYLTRRADRRIRTGRSLSGRLRPGTVMIFVLGILTLLALIGIGLVASTRLDQKRVNNEAAIASTVDSVDAVVKQIQQTLVDDIWSTQYPTILGAVQTPLEPNNQLEPGGNNNRLGILEYNEPFDAPGPYDRWLSSLMPYRYYNPGVAANFAHVFRNQSQFNVGDPATGNAAFPDEADVLIWPEVSYLGSDLLTPQSGGTTLNQFVWKMNTRVTVGATVPISYGPLAYPANGVPAKNPSLSNVPVLQTPPPIDNLPIAYDGAVNRPFALIPGSTTNVTIRKARAAWENWRGSLSATDLNNLAVQLGRPAGSLTNPQFPYFDTNADGIVDLYDADGDGVPDSPISFVIDGNSTDPNNPSRLYAVVRIVDHGAMLNANIASSFWYPLSTGLTFSENAADYQRRGRRTTEFVLDDLCHAGDRGSPPGGGMSNRIAGLMNYRSGSAPNRNDPVELDRSVVRRDLIGGPSLNLGYRLYSLSDEASLRNRFSLVPSSLASYRKNQAANPTVGYEAIDTSLRWTMLWSNQLGNTPTLNSYLPASSRWTRFNADFNSVAYEGYNQGLQLGFRHLLTEDDTGAIRRMMVTTVNHDVVPPTNDAGFNGNALTALAGVSPVSRVNPTTGALVPVNMTWPVTPSGPGSASLPFWMRMHQINLNQTDVPTTNDVTVQTHINEYLGSLAAAMYLALGDPANGGLTALQGTTLTPLLRQRLAWQFAANVVDYRDSDQKPTMLEMPAALGGGRIFGLEKQPFFTEAYCRVAYNQEDPPNPADDDDWFDAVELHVPAGWKIADLSKLFLRTPGSGTQSGIGQGICLNQFLNSGGATPDAYMDGGEPTVVSGDRVLNTTGAYVVFCGRNVSVAAVNGNVGAFFANNGFQINHGAAGSSDVELVYYDAADPQSEHVLDVIGPKYASKSGLSLNPIDSLWAKRVAPAPNGHNKFVLKRSTDGWRFTNGWHLYDDDFPAPSISLFQFETLGQKNDIDPASFLNTDFPEMVWATRTSLQTRVDNATGEVPDGFKSGTTFEAFDSVPEIARIPIIGPTVGLGGGGTPNCVTERYAASMQQINPTGATATDKKLARMVAGHIDFVTGDPIGTPPAPWSWRLLRYLTTTSVDGDGVDNNGAGGIDDAYEGAQTMFRRAGRININTAPVTVLRSVPFMAMLPNMMQFQGMVDSATAGNASANPYAYYNNAPMGYWDFASAIVAARENRIVEVRLPDSSGALQRVAQCSPLNGGALAYRDVMELSKLTSQTDGVLGNNSMFRIDRHVTDVNLPLRDHNLAATPTLPQTGTPRVGTPSVFSPDFRVRPAQSAGANASAVAEWMDFAPAGLDNAATYDSGGLRGRDIYLDRLANVLTTRSDVFTAYIALIDEDGNYVRRAQVTLDRSPCFGEIRVGGSNSNPILPSILLKSEGSYTDETR